MSTVLLWHTVTVADAFSSIIATGLPTISDRPSTTACCPLTGTPLRFRISIIPAGVHGASAARPARHGAALCNRPT